MLTNKENVCPAENKRRTYINSIERARAVIRTPEFVESSPLKIQETLDELKITFKRFEEKHQALVQWATKEEFEKQDDIYAQVEKNYRQVVVAYKQQLIVCQSKIETNESVTSEESSAVPKNEPDSNESENTSAVYENESESETEH